MANVGGMMMVYVTEGNSGEKWEIDPELRMEYSKNTCKMHNLDHILLYSFKMTNQPASYMRVESQERGKAQVW